MKSILIALTITSALLATYSLVKFQKANASTKFLATPQYSEDIKSAWTQWT
jgi:C1A family cysteine protease